MGLAGHRPRLGAALAALALLAVALLATAPAAEAKPKSIRGIDVSRFQGHIAWKQVGKTQTKFAFLQASRGSGDDCSVVPEQCGADPTYLRNYKKARAEGIRVGAYHRAFASDPGTEIDGIEGAKLDAREEANLFASVVGQLRGRDLRPVLDVETPFKGLDEIELQAWIKAWLSRVERKLGSKPIIYTNNSSWQATGDTTTFALDGHPLWVANFGVPSPLVPAANWAGKGWTIWQYTSIGHVRGIAGNVDKNKLARGFGKIKAR
ncbi:MAG: glycoside hydrolase family 25 protein [Solirubrobacterales bacterium]|nr:glycoside hydrolase family 25 protein [Solirubrobacterales bacterium]MCB8970575.1 glycoside hydrolase family 25 protein [Thermoleophilales bacterium]MCO5325736.1 glycoside hydrolase family 25 protein [Solirubrobacterales bacterium]